MFIFVSWSFKNAAVAFLSVFVRFGAFFNVWRFYSSTLELQNALVLRFFYSSKTPMPFAAQKRLCGNEAIE